MKKFLIAILALIGAGYFTGYESKIFGTAYFNLGLHYDYKLQVGILLIAFLIGYLIYLIISKKSGFRLNRTLFVLAIFLISGTTYTGGFLNNTPRVYSVVLFGADPTFTNDATPGIQAATNACDAGGGGDVYFINGTYKIAGALQTSVHSANPNCQIYIPSRGYYSATRNTIRFVGEGTTNFATGYLPSLSLPIPTTGVILRSTLSSGSGTNPSVIGTKDSASYLNFNYTDIEFKNITIETYTNHGASAPVLSGLNLQYAAKVTGIKLCVGIDTTVQASASPASSEVAGIIASHYSNDGPNIFQECFIWGYKYGYICSEHTYFINSYAIGDYYAYVFPFMNFTVSGKVLIHACPHGLYYPASNVMGILAGAAWTNLEVELETDSSTTNGFNTVWYKTLDQVTDASSYGHGVIRMMNLLDGGGAPLVINTPGSNIHAVPFDYLTGSGAPGGANTDVQYNSSSAFAGDAGLTYATATGLLALTNAQTGPTSFNAKNTNTSGSATVNAVASTYQIALLQYSSSHAAYGGLPANGSALYSTSTNEVIMDDNASGEIDLAAGSTPSVQDKFKASGEVDFGLYGVGTFTGATAYSLGVTSAGKLIEEAVGQTTLSSGTKAITITGLTTSSKGFVTLVSQSGTTTTTSEYIAVCTSNTLTISAVTNAGSNTVNTLDGSTVNYHVYQ